jgi:hypothetical protein
MHATEKLSKYSMYSFGRKSIRFYEKLSFFLHLFTAKSLDLQLDSGEKKKTMFPKQHEE